MGLTTWSNAPKGKNVKRIVTIYLDYAENQAKRRIPMTMEDWANKLNAFLQFNEYETPPIKNLWGTIEKYIMLLYNL